MCPPVVVSRWSAGLLRDHSLSHKRLSTSTGRPGGGAIEEAMPMSAVDSADIDHAVAEMLGVLGPHDSLDWRVRAGSLEWSCWKTAAHVAHDLLAYAGQVAARPTTAYLPFDLVIAGDASPREVLQVVRACGGLLSSAVAAADPDVRAWHWGLCDPIGFAAMGVAETLLH